MCLPYGGHIGEPIRVHNPYGISIGSADFAQFTSECRACRGMPLPSKLPLHMADLYLDLIRGTLGPPDSASQRTSGTVQAFLHSSRPSVLILYNGPPFPPQNCPFSCGDVDAYQICGSLGLPNPQPKWHLDQFSHFCRAHYCNRQTVVLGW